MRVILAVNRKSKSLIKRTDQLVASDSRLTNLLTGRPLPAMMLVFGVWRSPVAHLVWDQGVQGSNPCTPTKIDQTKVETCFCLGIEKSPGRPGAFFGLRKPDSDPPAPRGLALAACHRFTAPSSLRGACSMGTFTAPASRPVRSPPGSRLSCPAARKYTSRHRPPARYRPRYESPAHSTCTAHPPSPHCPSRPWHKGSRPGLTRRHERSTRPAPGWRRCSPAPARRYRENARRCRRA